MNEIDKKTGFRKRIFNKVKYRKKQRPGRTVVTAGFEMCRLILIAAAKEILPSWPRLCYTISGMSKRKG
jgi:hypothetical protein